MGLPSSPHVKTQLTLLCLISWTQGIDDTLAVAISSRVKSRRQEAREHTCELELTMRGARFRAAVSPMANRHMPSTDEF